jgi:succinate dehydrogenase/fumarate reductase flavoprotein subunit
MLTTDSTQWANISSVITVSLAQETSVYKQNSTQHYTAELHSTQYMEVRWLFVCGELAGVVGWCSILLLQQ